ncbi:NAD-dependent epimerase/dehydratase family protein [Proteiniphilum sp. X52]|uniref:NAD-dependent epimerase/dehydratase family protein n=1 Tax=Proteiniphilum sp. X52 TaxID=2382159 RepID=UPI000F0A3D97|nr:NAD-dependent epimerase/dehydratase family protein [Proteiniphilum sp. X52]RNC64758.1 NAD-dependent epimerase/dehydratase family protein [Proteiniphilum sp. X52]
MNILITGINGFVGSNFTKDWNKKHTLYGVDINQTPKTGVEKIFTWKQLSKIPPVDVIVHLAGKAHDTKNIGEAKVYFDVNTGLTQQIFDYFLQSEARTFIFFSSVKAAADTVPGDILTEEIIPHPLGPYGESKIKAEQYLLSKLTEAAKLQKKVFILRPCMIHGPGNKGNLNLLYNVVKKGIPWPLGAYKNSRSFCSIDNISYVAEQLIVKENIESGIYHVGDDEPISTNELIKLISESVGKKSHIWILPKGLMNAAAAVGGALKSPLNKERLRKLTENYVVSNVKIKQALGIDKMPVSTREGIRKTLDSFR